MMFFLTLYGCIDPIKVNQILVFLYVQYELQFFVHFFPGKSEKMCIFTFFADFLCEVVREIVGNRR